MLISGVNLATNGKVPDIKRVLNALQGKSNKRVTATRTVPIEEVLARTKRSGKQP